MMNGSGKQQNGKKQNGDRDLEEIQSQHLEVISPQDMGDGSKNENNDAKNNAKNNAKTPKGNSSQNSFDQPLVLSQSPKWIQTILWTFLGALTVGLVWASVAKIEESIPAQGKLEPQGAVKEVRLPANGVLKEILVQDGQRVKTGDVLLRIDATAAKAQLESLQKLRRNLQQENQFYRDVLNGKRSVIDPAKAVAVPAEFLALARNREALATEIEMYRMQVNGGSASLTSDQQDRLTANRAELSSRSQAAEANIAQLVEQLNQTRINRAGRQSSLAIDKKILDDIEVVAKEGGIPRSQYLKQKQQVLTTESEIRQLAQEEMRIKAAIAEGKARLNNTFDTTRKELTAQIADNTKRMAEIDSQFTKALVDNSKRIAEIDGQVRQAEVTLKYQELRAPAAGTIFELKAGLGYVANMNASEVVLKIVPDDLLVAKVFITNQDIGFVKENMPVDVRIDSFPFTEFGDVKGKLIWIGSDALPPDQSHPTYRFPAKVLMERQSLSINGREIRLQSGMSLMANIKIRDRTVMSLFTDFFVKNTESLKFVR
ncbi:MULTISPECIES: HlyD family efflux transporter periplasmic adaptor subunit [Pseudanabaena]|uniref:Secretion protein HlyD family protein n=2 Tax=Pseudanabaena TaxID=1152 RepID=L8MVE1_9CYAN|nr:MULTISPECIES: HlyD family efflux transporter periplasmic adaptor subunit [Pseudanabaena]ELS31451.1 secretion protein HlyD family protein [Pseudanabaena biceps PCC 7429]MDG3496291.1 HlyD family efflux transporter periplasmic adaptor subunit [Pseudanabaena catenata USMAC16]